MMTGWPRRSESLCPTMRAIRSLPPPGVKPTTMWIARVGYFDGSSSARAVPSVTTKASPRHRLIARYRQDLMMSQPGDVNMQHGGLAVIERGKTAIDGACQLVRLADAFAMGAEGLRQERKIPPLALAA